MEEVQRRDGGDSGAWIVVGDSVYDVTNFADEHPGFFFGFFFSFVLDF